MRKSIFTCIVLMLIAFVASSFTTKTPASPTTNGMQRIVVHTGENGAITSVSSGATISWRITDLSGATNIRNKPNGKVCMKLKAWTDYVIYTKGSSNGWLCISSIYNESEGYWLRLHGSNTGRYWIARSILY